MARGRKITDEVIKDVSRLHYNHPSYTAAKVRSIVNKRFCEQGITSDKKWPSLSAVQKIIQSLRRESFLDNEWTVQSLSNCEIPPEALPLVLDAYGWTVAWGLEKRLTVREAKWVSRLYHVLTDTEELTIAARECALHEKISEPVNSTNISLVDTDFITRAIKGKPGVTYKHVGNGEFQFIIHQRGFRELDINALFEPDDDISDSD